MSALPRPGLWGALFILNMMLITLAHIFDLIELPVPPILMAINMVLLVPMVRAARSRQELAGAVSPALRRYNRRMLTCGVIYMVAMIGAANVYNAGDRSGPLVWLLAILPVLPMLGMILAMYRYYHEEDDEFLRHRAVTGALVGLVLVLVLGTAWGFLEMFGLVPHLWNWWVFPVWALGLGVGTCWPGSSRADSQEAGQ